MTLEKNNYYEVLDISINSTPEQIHDGYIKAKNTYSPEGAAMYSLLTEKECLAVLEEIEMAYSVLSIPGKRVEYDRVRKIVNQYTQDVKISRNFDSPRRGEKNKTSEQEAKTDEFKITQNDVKISKMSAQGRFSLQYDRDEVFEQEIDNAQIFTGTFLKKIREYKKVDLERMTDLTRVSKTYIKQIEDEEFDKLPAIAYVRGFVYQYAKCLKLNPEQVATSYVNYVKQQKTASPHAQK